MAVLVRFFCSVYFFYFNTNHNNGCLGLCFSFEDHIEVCHSSALLPHIMISSYKTAHLKKNIEITVIRDNSGKKTRAENQLFIAETVKTTFKKVNFDLF